jgi:hypothetical protein
MRPLSPKARKTNPGGCADRVQFATYPQSPFSGPVRCCDVTDLCQAFSQRTGSGRLWISLGAGLFVGITQTNPRKKTRNPSIVVQSARSRNQIVLLVVVLEKPDDARGLLRVPKCSRPLPPSGPRSCRFARSGQGRHPTGLQAIAPGSRRPRKGTNRRNSFCSWLKLHGFSVLFAIVSWCRLSPKRKIRADVCTPAQVAENRL